VYLYVEDVDSIIPAGAVAEACPLGHARGKADRPGRERSASRIAAPGSGTAGPLALPGATGAPSLRD
jgi:hypothetical protein